MMLDIAIVGGGLSGLSLAHRLLKSQLKLSVFESANHFGGRVLCRPPSSTAPQQSKTSIFSYQYDMGPGWIWPDFQPRIAKFVAHNEIGIFSQWHRGNSLYHRDRSSRPEIYIDDATYAAARRVKGGSHRLIETLLMQLPGDALHANHHLIQVIDHQDYVELGFRAGDQELSVTARRLVLTIPPRLLADSVAFTPHLDEQLVRLMSSTSTWMAGHAKAVMHFPQAFWRDQGLSGNAFSAYQGAALSELFDACSDQREHAVLSGFFALPPALRRQYRDDLTALIMEQLVRLFGKQATEMDEIRIQDWSEEKRLSTPADEIPPAGHPQYGHPWLQAGYWNNKLFFGGTESAPQFGGYLEGALEAAERVASKLIT